MAEPMYSAKHYAIKAQKQADRAKEYAENVAVSSFGNIGDIKYTSRTDVPSGGAWCDGAEYTQAQFPDLYQMLIDGKLQHTDYTTFDESVSTNGSCGFFGLNTETTSFKVPKLSNVYLKAGQAPLMFGAESLPNIIGRIDQRSNSGGAEGAFIRGTSITNQYAGSGTNNENFYSIDFNASRSSSTYQDGAKVNPEHVVYRAYVVLYSNVLDDPSSVNKAYVWAEGSDSEVQTLGGEHSAKGWAEEAKKNAGGVTPEMLADIFPVVDELPAVPSDDVLFYFVKE